MEDEDPNNIAPIVSAMTDDLLQYYTIQEVLEITTKMTNMMMVLSNHYGLFVDKLSVEALRRIANLIELKIGEREGKK